MFNMIFETLRDSLTTVLPVAAVFLIPLIIAHMESLHKGGLIQRASKEVHTIALERIYCKTPNVKLPRAKFF